MSTYILYAVGALLIFFGLTLFSIGNIFMSFASFVLGFLAVSQGVKIKKRKNREKNSFIDPKSGKFYVKKDNLKNQSEDPEIKAKDFIENEDDRIN